MALALRPYQEVGRDFLADRTRALLADEMRVGKTPQAILAALKIGAKKICVVCPAIAVRQWIRELKRWGGYDAVNIAERSVEQWSADVTVSSYDRAKHLTNREWDVLIVDEAHYCKNPQAARTKLIYGKGGLGYRAGRIWALSGTPAPNHAGELYPMLAAFGAIKMSYSAYLQRYCYLDAMYKPLGTRVSRIPELKQILDTVMLRRKRKEVAPDMPDIDFQFMPVEGDISGLDIIMKASYADDAAVQQQLQHLAKYIANPVGNITDYAGEFTLARQYAAYAKTTALVEEIRFNLAASLYKQTVVFGFYVRSLQEVVNTLRRHGVKAEMISGATDATHRERYQERFREGHVEVLVCQIIAAGTAIDLSAADHGYFLELDWVPGNNLQAANRLVSMTKKTPVTYDIVTWAGSPDDAVQRSLSRKVAELSKLI